MEVEERGQSETRERKEGKEDVEPVVGERDKIDSGALGRPEVLDGML